jgi:hypothetical protein
MTTVAIRRVGPPQAVQKVRENMYALQVLLSDAPNADWKRLFYDMQRDFPPDFPPRSVDITGSVMRFRSEPSSVEQKIALIDRWIARANEKEASMGARTEEERHRREEMTREVRELADLNSRWAKL